MAHAAEVARAQGCFSFDRLERAALPPVPGWIAPGLSAQDYATALVGSRLQAPSCWPFRQDAPLGDFAVTDGPKWWTHGQLHALVGGAYWPEMSEWEVAHMARLSEAVASWHWYWLSELDRRYCDAHSVTTADQTPDCDACRALEAAAHSPATRLERLASEEAHQIAANGLAFLHYEAHCYTQGLETGVLIVPEGSYLSMGEACDYARLHRERLVSPSQVRWLEACMVPGRDYATDLEAFAARATTVAQALITPCTPPTSVAGPRARRVLQDLGQRLCHGAALEGRPHDGFSRGLQALADGLAAIETAKDDDGVATALHRALDEVAADLTTAPSMAAQVLALGYRPTTDPSHEPQAMRDARVGALHRRARAVRSPLTPLLTRSTALGEAVVSRPRSADLLTDAALAAQALSSRSGDDALVAAFVGWLTLAAQHWGPEDAAPHLPGQWTYRLALRSLPEPARFHAVRVRPNPYLTSLPSPFDVAWLEALISDALPEHTPAVPRAAQGVGYALMGQGRAAPIFLPFTAPRRDLLNRLQHTPTIAELLEDGVSQDALSKALDEELVVALQQREPVTLQVTAADGQVVESQGADLNGATEDPGPWESPEQAAYYARYCQRSTLYQGLAQALVSAAEVEAHHALVDLGCGTGVSTQAALDALGPEGTALAIDPAPKMIAIAQENLDDPRVSFEVGTARRLVQLGGPYDRVLCNSAIWLDPYIVVPCKAAQMVLAPGGRLAFSLPAEFLGHTEHWATEVGQDLAQAIARARGGDGGGDITPIPHPDYLGSTARITAVLKELGFAEVTTHPHLHPWSVGEYLDWLAQPVALDGVCPGGADTQAAFLQEVRGAVDLDAPFASHWVLVVART